MKNTGSMVGSAAVLALLALLAGCKKETDEANAAALASATTPAAEASATPATVTAAAAVASAGAPLSGLDPCIVGGWKSTQASLKLDPVSAEGGANVALDIRPSGDSVIDFTPMSPVHGKGAGAGADFDFQYAGKASALLSTPTRGTMTSTKADYSALRVTAEVKLPGAGKFPLLKNEPLTKLAQMATSMAGKAPAAAGSAVPGAAPPGIDSSPLFSMTRYTCQSDTLTLSDEKGGVSWAFSRASR